MGFDSLQYFIRYAEIFIEWYNLFKKLYIIEMQLDMKFCFPRSG